MARAVVVQLILTDDLRGAGVEGSPYRRVRQLWTLDGKLVAEQDNFPDGKGKGAANDLGAIREKE